MIGDKYAVNMVAVTKIYPKAESPAVSDLTLQLQPGEILGLLGPNGAGKTTAVKMIAGLVSPTTGVVQVMGHDIARNRTKGARHIGAVLEGARNLYWRLSAWENLRYFGSLRLVPRHRLSLRIEELLTLFDLQQNKHQEVRYFSRGMQQKLAIAAALMHDPDVLLLDEPTLGLDVKAARQLEEIVARLAREQGKAILLTTHMMDVAAKLAGRITVIHRGQQVASNTTHDLLAQYHVQEDVTEIQVADPLPDELLIELQPAFPHTVTNNSDDLTQIAFPSLRQADLIALMQRFEAQGIRVQEVTRRRATLEEVFLSLTEERETYA